MNLIITGYYDDELKINETSYCMVNEIKRDDGMTTSIHAKNKISIKALEELIS